MQTEPATHDEIVELLGEVDQLLVDRLLDSSATVAELEEAIELAFAEQQRGEQPFPSSGRVASVREILAEMIPENAKDGRADAPVAGTKFATRQIGEKEVAMKIGRIMTTDVRACNSADTLARAAQLMWDHDIGAVPVVDENGHLVGMVTDRDACMAAYTRGQRLADIPVVDVMSTNVVACVKEAKLDEVERLMATAKVRRIPVIDGMRRLIGIVSLNDLAIAMQRREVTAVEVADTLAAVSEPRRDLFPTA